MALGKGDGFTTGLWGDCAFYTEQKGPEVSAVEGLLVVVR